MDRDSYLDRIGVDPETVPDDGTPGFETLARLQRAHVRSVPFETLAVNGDPYADAAGRGVSLALPDLYEKVVERERGGFCFELNGLFGWLLADIGYDADRVAARVVGDDGSRPPANHHTHLVRLDRPYLVDVGLGSEALRQPTPLDGTAVTDAAGIDWRVAESDRPNGDYALEYRPPGGAWDERYFFRTTPRTLAHFQATCEYLATDPESAFVGDPVLTISTDDGYLKLNPGTLTRWSRGETTERSVTAEEWPDLLAAAFGVEY